MGRRALAGRAVVSRWDPLLIALAGVILQYVWRIQEVFPFLRYVQFTAVASAAALLLYLTDGSPLRRFNAALRHPLFRIVLAIVALAILSVPTSLRDGASVQFLTGNFLKTIVLAAVLAAAIRDQADVDRLLRVFVAGGAAYIVTSVAFASGGGRLAGKGSYDPNDLGLFAVSTIPLCIYLMRRGASRKDRALGLGSALLLLFGTVQSGSRGGFLALVALSLYGLLGLSVIRSSKRLTVLVLAVGALAVFGSDAYWSRIRTILKPQEDYNWTGQSEGGRLEIWKRGLGYMAQRPIFGVGVDQFPVAEGTLSPQAARQEWGIGFRWSAAHNSYVQIGAELGVFGLLAYVLLLGRAYYVGRRIGKRGGGSGARLLGQAFAGLVVAYAIGGAFLSQAYSTYLYLALAILIGFSRVAQPGLVSAAAPAVSRAAARRRSMVPMPGPGPA